MHRLNRPGARFGATFGHFISGGRHCRLLPLRYAQTLRPVIAMHASLLRASVLLLILGPVPAGICAAQVLPPTAAARFEILDTNRDGVVDKSEYESNGLFAKIDSNRNNRISPEELQSVLGPQEDGAPSAADRIRVADGNDDGELTDEELRRAAEMRFSWLDSNNDGDLDLAEMKSGFGIPALPR